MDCEQSGEFAIIQTVFSGYLEDAAFNADVAVEDVTCEQVCTSIRMNEGMEITVDEVTMCDWDVDPTSGDSGELGQISCTGRSTEQTCLG